MIYRMLACIVDLQLIFLYLCFCYYGNFEGYYSDESDENYCDKNFIMSTPDSSTYIAAVIEYHPEYATNINETLKKNSDAYAKYIKTARMYNADIIVFPENGLTTIKLPKREEMQDWTTIIPAASFNYTPCTDSTIEVNEALKKISCAARKNTIYVVINIAEKLPCTGDVCPKDKMFYYNSNVVFDRTGKIIARYRKTNLFGELQFNVTSKPEIVIFDTDFGVKFGTFICFDILFHEPALQLTRVHQVTDIVYPTAWFSEAPFLTAVQTQAGWSFSEDVNLLVSGYNEPASGNTGSGIYLGREGIGKAIMSKTTRDGILVFEVPKKKKMFNKDHHDHSKDYDHKVYNHEKENIHEELWKKQFANTMADNGTIFLIHDNINVFETFSLEGNVTRNVCKNNFCCDFKVEVVTIDPSKKYRLITFSGIRLYATVEAGVHVCGIVQCLNDSVSSCGSVQDSKTIFSRIEIDITFYDYKNILIMPSMLRSDLLPLSENWTYNEHIHDDHIHISMLLNNNTNNLTTFGIYSRYFNKNNASRIDFDAIHYFINLFSIIHCIVLILASLIIAFIVSDMLYQIVSSPYKNPSYARLVDSRMGIQISKRSITASTDFIKSIIIAYANLVHRPLVLIVGFFFISTYFGHETNTSTPAKCMLDRSLAIINNTSSAKWEILLATLLHKIFELLLIYEKQLLNLGFAWLPYLAKPSRNIACVCFFHSLLIFLLRNWHLFNFVLLANAHFLFVTLRNPAHKLIIILIIFIFFYWN